jgi:hypothetical protein
VAGESVRLWKAGVDQLSRSIEQHLAPRLTVNGVRTDLYARAAAAAAFGLLNWWVDQDSPPPPAAMDASFHAFLGPLR